MTFIVINLGEWFSSSSIWVTKSEMFCLNHYKQVIGNSIYMLMEQQNRDA